MLFHLIFSIMPMFVCLFWVALLLSDGKGNLPKHYLAFFLALSVINYFTHASFFNHQYALFGFMDNIWVFTSLAGYAMYYYYIRLLTRDVNIDWRRSWIIVPSVLLSAFSFVLYVAMSPQELEVYIHGVMYHESGYGQPYPPLVQLQLLRMSLFKIVFVVQVVVSVYFGYRLITRYNKAVREFYSNTGGKDLNPVKWVLMAFVFASVISLLSNAVGKDFFVDKEALLSIPSITHSLFLFLIGYVGYHQNFTISDFANDVNEYNHNEMHADEAKKTATSKVGITKQQLHELMEKDALFKNPELRITDLALLLGTNRTYVSRIVNDEMHTNFSDWVNGYRFDYAKKLMDDLAQKNLSLHAISEMAGFASMSAFYRIFKEKEGVSPGKYRVEP